MQKSLIAGRIDDDFFDREIGQLRADLDAAHDKLAHAPEARVITLHPAALTKMRRTLEILRAHLPDNDPKEDTVGG